MAGAEAWGERGTRLLVESWAAAGMSGPATSDWVTSLYL